MLLILPCTCTYRAVSFLCVCSCFLPPCLEALLPHYLINSYTAFETEFISHPFQETNSPWWPSHRSNACQMFLSLGSVYISVVSHVQCFVKLSFIYYEMLKDGTMCPSDLGSPKWYTINAQQKFDIWILKIYKWYIFPKTWDTKLLVSQQWLAYNRILMILVNRKMCEQMDFKTFGNLILYKYSPFTLVRLISSLLIALSTTQLDL